jgi:hypothetical protein
MLAIATEKDLELPAGHHPPGPEGPEEGNERSAETVLQFVYLPGKA